MVRKLGCSAVASMLISLGALGLASAASAATTTQSRSLATSKAAAWARFSWSVGEHSSEVRAQAAAGLAFLGVAVDGARNVDTQADGEIGAQGAAVRTLVLTAREDSEIARQVKTALSRQPWFSRFGERRT